MRRKIFLVNRILIASVLIAGLMLTGCKKNEEGQVSTETTVETAENTDEAALEEGESKEVTLITEGESEAKAEMEKWSEEITDEEIEEVEALLAQYAKEDAEKEETPKTVTKTETKTDTKSETKTDTKSETKTDTKTDTKTSTTQSGTSTSANTSTSTGTETQPTPTPEPTPTPTPEPQPESKPDMTTCSHDFQYYGPGFMTAGCTNWGESLYECTKCGAMMGVADVAPLGHDYSIREVKAWGDCASPGVVKYTCSRCGDNYEAFEMLSADAHIWKTVSGERLNWDTGEYEPFEETSCERCGKPQ